MNNFYVSIDGNISSGKSTLFNSLKEKFRGNEKVIFLEEPVSFWEKFKDQNGKNIIEHYYEDKEKYGFAFQMMAYITRYNILMDAIRGKSNCIIISERTLNTDKLVFAQMLYDLKIINDIEFTIYNEWFKILSSNFKIDHLIYIKTPPEVCFQRAAHRNRKGENLISLEYLNLCDTYHDNMVSTYQHFEPEKHVFVEIDGLMSPEVISDNVYNIISIELNKIIDHTETIDDSIPK